MSSYLKDAISDLFCSGRWCTTCPLNKLRKEMGIDECENVPIDAMADLFWRCVGHDKTTAKNFKAFKEESYYKDMFKFLNKKGVEYDNA